MHKGLGKHAFQGLISCSIFGGSVLAIDFVYLFFFGEDFWRSYCGRGDLEAFRICPDTWTSFVIYGISDIILLRFKIRESIYHLSIPCEFKKKKREVKTTTASVQDKKKNIEKYYNDTRSLVTRHRRSESKLKIKGGGRGEAFEAPAHVHRNGLGETSSESTLTRPGID